MADAAIGLLVFFGLISCAMAKAVFTPQTRNRIHPH